MNTTQVKKFKWFWAWNDDKEEAWLSDMARQGLHLEHIAVPGFYTFRKGEPANYVYRLDFQSLRSKDRESYLQLFQDAGWEHVGDMSGWVYFRILADQGERPEIFSDAESKMAKYYRVMMTLIIFLPILIILRPDRTDGASPFFFILQGLFAVLMLLYVTALINLMRRMDQVKKSQK